MSTRVGEFLQSISSFLHKKDAASLKEYLVVEPPMPDAYRELTLELQNVDIDKAVDLIDNDDAWPGFLAFMRLYLEFFRTVDYADLLETHVQLSALVKYAPIPIGKENKVNRVPVHVSPHSRMPPLAS